jgi:hypothetical protein
MRSSWPGPRFESRLSMGPKLVHSNNPPARRRIPSPNKIDDKGAYSLFVTILINFCCGRNTRGLGLLLFFNITAFAVDLTAFVLSLTGFPYTAGCDSSDYSGCQTLKAAIGLDCVLWYSQLSVVLMIGSRSW